MSPYQLQSLLQEYLQKHLLFPDAPPSDPLELSEDGLLSAKKMVPVTTEDPKLPSWIGPNQVLKLVEDPTPLDPVVDYEIQRSAARFMSSAKFPSNPLPPFLLVSAPKTDLVKMKSSVEDKAEVLEEMDQSLSSFSQESNESSSHVGTSENMYQETDGKEDFREKEELDAEVKIADSADINKKTQKNTKKDKKSEDVEKIYLADIVDDDEEDLVSKNKTSPSAAQLLDFNMDEDDKDFDEEEGLHGEDIDESDVVFGTGQITQPSMLKFMHQYPDSVLKFLLRRNLDGRPLPTEYDRIYEQWNERGLLRGRLKRHLMHLMKWEQIPDLPINELVSKIRVRIIEIKLNEE